MIRFLVMDVDGTLTDGKVYMGTQGELMKAFNIKDGYGIKELLPRYGILPIIITARCNDALLHRCKELGIAEVHQNVRDKVHRLEEVLARYSGTMSEVAYMGDDLLDLQCMMPVRQQGGLVAAPTDAAPAVLASSDYVAPHKAGEGAVRDLIDYLIANNQQPVANSQLPTRLQEAVAYIEQLPHHKLTLGTHRVSGDFFFNVMEYIPSDDENLPYESHRRYIDIQYLVAGEEHLMVTDISHLQPTTDYSPDKDCVLYNDHSNRSFIKMRPGTCVVLFPKDAHRAVRCPGSTGTVRKIVGKLLLHCEDTMPAL